MSSATMSVHEAISIGRLDAHDQVALVRQGELSASELIEAAILRIETLDPQINAVSYRAFELARERAARPHLGALLAGAPYLIKDSLDYPGMPSRAGSRSRSDKPATAMYPFIARFDRAGLVPVGKSAMPEFGLMGTTEPLRYGPTRNPWGLERSAGGSSGGATAAVAAGLVPLAHASDAAGSIRVPASLCGVFGFKPSRGMNVRARAQHFVDDYLCSDVLVARSVRDATWAFAMARPEHTSVPSRSSRPRHLRIALVLRGLYGALPEPEISDAMHRTARLCEQLGHHVTETEWPVDGSSAMHAMKVLWGYVGADVVQSLRAVGTDRPVEQMLEPFTLGLGDWGSRFGAADLERALTFATDSARALAAFFNDYDLVLSPVTSKVAPLLGELAPTRPFDALLEDLFTFMSYTPLQNLSGTPAMSIPLFVSREGLPIGSMFAADRDRDDLLFDLAFELQDAQPWNHRWPALSA